MIATTLAKAPLRFDLVAAVIAETLRIEPRRVTPCATLHATLSCDSLDRQSIACELDIAFGIEIPDDDVTAWQTALDVARTVARLTLAEVA